MVSSMLLIFQIINELLVIIEHIKIHLLAFTTS